MPHLSIQVDDSIDIAAVAETQSKAIGIIAGQFDIPTGFVASGVGRQERYCLNRKTIEVTVSAASDAEGKRKSNADALADQLYGFYLDWLRDRGVSGSVGVSVQIIETNPYREGAC